MNDTDKNDIPVRHLKVVHTKAKTDKPWLVVEGFRVDGETASGRPVRSFQAENLISEHSSRADAVEIVRRAGAVFKQG